VKRSSRGWTTRPGYASPDGTVHVNAQGLRALREYAEPAPSGVRRVIACGESFTFAEEVSDAEAWSVRLEEVGSEPGAPLEVLNYGVGGYGTDQALLRVSSEARGPVEALLVGLMLENIGRNVNRYRPLWSTRSGVCFTKPRFLLEDGERLPVLRHAVGRCRARDDRAEDAAFPDARLEGQSSAGRISASICAS